MAATAPRRGKFLPPSSSPSSPTPEKKSSRGKFLGKPAASPSSGQGASSFGSHVGDIEKKDSLDKMLKAHISNSKISAVSRRKKIAEQRDRVFRDLDEAENTVLSLLELSSDMSNMLSEMTLSKLRHGEKGDDGDEIVEESFEDIILKVRANGVGYLAGVKSLHKLLAPHACLVKSYKNHDGGEPTDTDTNTSNRSLAAALPCAAEASNRSNIVEEATSNMYAARVKKRLAMERSEILTEMIRLEELEGSSNDESEEQFDHHIDNAGSKRKHESI